VHFVGLFFVFIIENARSKKQKQKKTRQFITILKIFHHWNAF